MRGFILYSFHIEDLASPTMPASCKAPYPTTTEHLDVDVVVVGGGLAGVCAAIAAARAGAEVVLVQNRPVLGGNSSSEVRVWVCGATATGHQRFARETGIVGELYSENQFRNPEGNPYYWDLVLLEAVKAEPHLTLLLNTDVHTVDVEEDRLTRVKAKTLGSERQWCVGATVFIDCTGDGFIGAAAGAEFLLGREAGSQHDEELAPAAADTQTLGSTLLFYTKDIGRPVPFIAPSFAIDVTSTSIPEQRIIRTGDNGADYWWIEWGGELDIVQDNERIRDELWAVIYGIWDYIKNSGKFDAEHLTLEWVGSVPGKREYRRLLGDVLLTESDITPDATPADAVAYGGWSIDLHPARGVYHAGGAAQQRYPDGVYPIPLRALYSRSISNLLMAGRNISATHVAFGSTRVMATCGVMGEAVGAAAALCAEGGVTPRHLATREVERLQQHLLAQDASVVGIRTDTAADVASLAEVSASSRMSTIAVTDAVEAVAMTSDLGLVLPVSPRLGDLEVCLRVEEARELRWTLHSTDHPAVYVPGKQVRKGTVNVPRGDRTWVRLCLDVDADELDGAGDAVLVLHADDALSWWVSDQPVFGLLSLRSRIEGSSEEIDAHVVSGTGVANRVVTWDVKKLRRRPFLVRSFEPTDAYVEQRVVDGYQRPWAGPHVWTTDPGATGPHRLTLEWARPQHLDELVLIFNDDVDEYLNNLHYHRTPFAVMPEIVRDYRLRARTEAGWHLLAEVVGNRSRRRNHAALEEPVTAVELLITATNGSPVASVVAIRAHPRVLQEDQVQENEPRAASL